MTERGSSFQSQLEFISRFTISLARRNYSKKYQFYFARHETILMSFFTIFFLLWESYHNTLGLEISACFFICDLICRAQRCFSFILKIHTPACTNFINYVNYYILIPTAIFYWKKKQFALYFFFLFNFLYLQLMTCLAYRLLTLMFTFK